MKMTLKKPTSAFSLVEMMVAIGLGSLVVLSSTAFSMYTARSYAALTNYSEMDELGQLAVDKFTQQVRQVRALTSYATNSLTFQDYDGLPLTFTYNPTNSSFSRVKGGVTSLLLTNCNSLAFTLYQRTPQPFTFDAVTTTVATNCKLVEVTWSCSRNIYAGDKATTEIVQSAKVAIRQN